MELLVVISIAGILASIAIPEMASLMRNTRMKSTRDLLVSDLNMARSEAIKRNARVLVCAANTAKTDCNANTDWGANGWLICEATTAGTNCLATTSVNPSPIVIRGKVNSSLQLIAGNTSPVTYKSTGYGLAAASMVLTATGSTTQYTVAVAQTGSISSTKN